MTCILDSYDNNEDGGLPFSSKTVSSIEFSSGKIASCTIWIFLGGSFRVVDFGLVTDDCEFEASSLWVGALAVVNGECAGAAPSSS